MRKTTDMIGMRIYHWYVLARAPNDQSSRARWTCKCDCGTVKDVDAWNLRNGKSKSCGCVNAMTIGIRNKTHGQSKSRLYRIWLHMRERCNNPNVERYPHYGGRGIRVCEEWNLHFEPFFMWAVNNGYDEELSIDRIDVNGNYCPENCRWIPFGEQSRNTRRNRIIKIDSEKCVTLAELAEMTGIMRETLAKRLNKGWDIQRAMQRKNYNNGGKYHGKKGNTN